MKTDPLKLDPPIVPPRTPESPEIFWERWERKGLSSMSGSITSGSTSALPAILNLRRRSLIRASLLVLLSVVAAAWLSDFPHNRASPFIAIPTMIAFAGTADTVRCMRRTWSFYHGGVILLIYMDLMADVLILFFLLYPYALWLTASR